MRRPVMYFAGLLLATGASLALAGPASAAASDGEWDPFGNNSFVRANSTTVDYVSNKSVDLQDNRRFSNVGLINVGTSQGDKASASSLLAGILGLTTPLPQ